ncbi:hypothetical protein ISCGN_000495 [Ixodes scapularis]
MFHQFSLEPLNPEVSAPGLATSSPLNSGSRSSPPWPSTSTAAQQGLQSPDKAPRKSRSLVRREYTPRTQRVITRLRLSNSLFRQMLYRANERQDRLKQLSRAELVRNASKYLRKEALEIFRVQLYLQLLSKFGRRWPDSFKPFALNLYFHSPEAYKYLAK